MKLTAGKPGTQWTDLPGNWAEGTDLAALHEALDAGARAALAAESGLAEELVLELKRASVAAGMAFMRGTAGAGGLGVVLDAIADAAARQASGPGEWAKRGACREADPELFYDSRRKDEAKAVCAGCPVRPECRAYALDFPEKEGVWGGLDADERLLLSSAGTERTCGRCGCSKPVTEFSPDGHGGWKENCRPCRAEAESESRKRRRETRNGTAGDSGSSGEEKGTRQ